jgi:DNA-binding MarR family transcriptional regulator
MLDAAASADLEPQRHVGYLIRRAQQHHIAAWSRIVSTEISSVQYAILVVLDRMGSASQRELCDEVDLDRSTVADLISRMEKRGLVRRWRDPADARRNAVALTDVGRSERHRLTPLVHEVQDELTAPLGDADRRQLQELLRRIL